MTLWNISIIFLDNKTLHVNRLSDWFDPLSGGILCAVKQTGSLACCLPCQKWRKHLPVYPVILTPFMPGGLFYRNCLNQSISSLRVSGQFLLLQCFIGMRVFHANSENPDQTPRSAASDLGLHCLPMSYLWDTGHKWVKAWLYLIVIEVYTCSPWLHISTAVRLCRHDATFI